MKHFLIFLLLLLLAVLGCEKNDILSSDEQITQIVLNFDDLQALGDSAWYEGWVIWGDDNDKYESIGVFQVDNNGNLSPSVFDVNLGYLHEAKSILITIESDDIPGYIVTGTVDTALNTTIYDSTEGPSKYKILGAKIIANSGTFSFGHADVLDFKLNEIEGNYFIDTPSDTLNLNPRSGLWFAIFDTAGAVIKGLNLPTLPAQWAYEGWIEINGVSISTGTFRNPGAPDDDIVYYDTLTTGHSFPGEDFLMNAPAGTNFPVDLGTTNSDIYITVKAAHPSNCNNPFSEIIVLEATIPSGAVENTVYSMVSNYLSLPTGTLDIVVELYE